MAKAKKEEKVKPLGIGAYAKQLILEGLSNTDVLTAVMKKFPECNANAGTIGWYRNNLKTSGEKVKASRDITKAAAKAKEGAKATKKAAKKAAPVAAETATANVSDLA